MYRKINWSYIVPCLYFVASLKIFEAVYKTSNVVIDEEFHLRQGKYYCSGQFDKWDNKITTFPGLYLLTSLLLPFRLCSTFYLRLVSLVTSAFNISLIYKIRQELCGKMGFALVDAVTIALLPPMYFFAHLYYTDIPSVTTILGMYYYSLKRNHKLGALLGFASVLMRQTNIIWVAFIFVTACADGVISRTRPRINKKSNRNESESFMDIVNVISYNLRNLHFLLGNIRWIITRLMGYIALLFSFVLFVWYNGSIVIGDKKAHQATIHLPQVLYFSLYVSFFGISLLLANGFETIKKCKKYWYIVLALTPCLFFIIKYNTIAHPYLLADNRHYVFYIWNRFFGKYSVAKYTLIPVYIFSLFLIQESLKHKKVVEQLMYFICLVLVLAFQALIELRYFMIPFLLLRLNINKTNYKCIFMELSFYIVVNILAFKVFFTKEIHWSDYEDVQRIIW